MARTTDKPMEVEDRSHSLPDRAAARPLHQPPVGLWIVVAIIVCGALVVAFASQGAAGLPPVIATIGVPVVCVAGIATIVVLRVSLFHSERRLEGRIKNGRAEANALHERYAERAAVFRAKAAKAPEKSSSAGDAW